MKQANELPVERQAAQGNTKCRGNRKTTKSFSLLEAPVSQMDALLRRGPSHLQSSIRNRLTPVGLRNSLAPL